MSKSFLSKLAGGVALGSAALLLGAPAAALAATDGPDKEPNNQQREWKRDSNDTTDRNKDQNNNTDKGDKNDKNNNADKNDKNDKPKTFKLKDKDGNGVICATNDQNAESGVAQTISNNTLTGGVNTFVQIGASAAVNANAQALVVCIRDLDVDVDVEVDLLSDILETVEASRASGAGTPLGQPVANIPALGGAYAGPNGAWVLPANGGVAAGEGPFADSNTGSLVAAGAGLMGVAALGGFGLLRRRSADGTVA
ncbi:hypothetical protein [Micromonospora sp. KC721]|uniref:hypothetical protein n=1 Tax=Micromonospora sp. KC721 TaxID=2530380 RepID=UPI0010464B36|nr:hypothetical protein [Micromonospora sp. KC721]TDB79424.1 hypothetical protein E1182_12815 [Micromonospora sp. KC721]